MHSDLFISSFNRFYKPLCSCNTQRSEPPILSFFLQRHVRSRFWRQYPSKNCFLTWYTIELTIYSLVDIASRKSWQKRLAIVDFSHLKYVYEVGPEQTRQPHAIVFLWRESWVNPDNAFCQIPAYRTCPKIFHGYFDVVFLRSQYISNSLFYSVLCHDTLSA